MRTNHAMIMSTVVGFMNFVLPLVGIPRASTVSCLLLSAFCFLLCRYESVSNAGHDDKPNRCSKLLPFKRCQEPDHNDRGCERHVGPAWRVKWLACHRHIAFPQ